MLERRKSQKEKTLHAGKTIIFTSIKRNAAASPKGEGVSIFEIMTLELLIVWLKIDFLEKSYMP